VWVPESDWPEADIETDRRRVPRWLEREAAFFDPAQPLYVTRAPGRLDVMGGIGDYSGALVLELPIAAATWVAVQAQPTPEIVIHSDDIRALGGDSPVTVALADIVPDRPLGYQRAHALLAADPRRAWASYAAGALVVLHAELSKPLRHGLRMLVHSEVPVGKGLSSSAALEVAALEALARIVGAEIDDRELGLLAQKVENFVVGAPCGVMDQMTSANGRRDHLLEILCQPAEIVGHVPLPEGLELFAVDSGIRHAVSGADYGTVRAAAFMGYHMITTAAGTDFGGYLANVPLEDWEARYRALVPETMVGREFIARYQRTTDPATTVVPDRVYPVRASTQHGIAEHRRVQLFRQLLDGDPGSWPLLGDLMYASHDSYSACGLGSDGTDRLVALVKQAGPAMGLHGAKITGGGSGGAVAVLASRGARGTVEDIAKRYGQETGRAPAVYAGSSDGSRAFGVRRLLPSPPPVTPGA
jgi:L-arabinokinase